MRNEQKRFHRGELAVQERAGVRTGADEVGEGIVNFVPERAADFLLRRQMVLLGTIDSEERPCASVIVGEPGFISVPDARRLRIGALPPEGDPARDNLARESHAALLAIDLVSPRRLRANGIGAIKDGAIEIKTEQVYGNCRRYIQERIFVGWRESLPAQAGEIRRASELSEGERQQIASADAFFIASDHPEQGADISHKGGDAGFVHVVGPRHIAYPDFNGNSMFNTLGNLTINPRAGLLFVDFASGRTLQLRGTASIDWNPDRARRFAGAERVVDFAIEDVIDNSIGFPLISKFRQFSRFNPKPEN
jgi:uncharacterized protein